MIRRYRATVVALAYRAAAAEHTNRRLRAELALATRRADENAALVHKLTQANLAADPTVRQLRPRTARPVPPDTPGDAA